MKKTIIAFFLVINYIISDVFADSVIQEIRCNGLQRISLDTVLFALPIKVGTILNKENIADCIKILFATGFFQEIFISNYNGIITITVKECPIINTITICKNKSLKSEEVQQILENNDIKSGNPLNQYALYTIKRNLENICYNFGKFNATVQIITTSLARNQSDVQIIFSENKSAKVSQIKIFGNRSFSQKHLLKQFTLYNQLKWKNITFRKTYQKQKLLHDLELLRDFYLNRGYAKFRIDDIQINISPDNKNVYLDIYINEGCKYHFKSTIICGNVFNYLPDFKEHLQIKPGELYNNKKIRETEYNIQYALGRYGYIKPNILTECSFDDCNKLIQLYIYIDVGRRFYVREIRFVGNDLTKDSVIRRELRQIEQAPLNYINVLQDQKQLQYFSYFKKVDTHIEYIPYLSNQLDLIYIIEERNTGNLNINFGFGTESGVNMQINIYQDNLLGTGNMLSMTTTKNRHQTYVDISMLKKYIGVKKTNISGKVFYNNFMHNNLDLSNYNMKNYGCNINYSYPLAMYISYDTGLSYISNNLNQIAPQIAIWRYLYSMGIDPLANQDNRGLNSNINIYSHDFLLNSTWTWNNLNRMYFPEFGSRVCITSNVTLPGSNNKYYKIIFDGNHYLSLDQHSKWVLMNTIYTGYAGGLYKPKESPFYDNFYIGGIETIRGFQLNGIGPKAAYYHCNDCDKTYATCSVRNSFDSIGGNAVTLVKNELTVPILSYINNKSEYFDLARLSLFIDAGTIWDTHWKNTEATRVAGISDYGMFSHIRISSGISLKWMSPIGPVMFSYAKLINKYPEDIEEPFQFSIGKSW